MALRGERGNLLSGSEKSQAEGGGEQERLRLRRNDDMVGYGSIDIYTPGILLELLVLNGMEYTFGKWRNTTGCCTRAWKL